MSPAKRRVAFVTLRASVEDLPRLASTAEAIPRGLRCPCYTVRSFARRTANLHDRRVMLTYQKTVSTEKALRAVRDIIGRLSPSVEVGVTVHYFDGTTRGSGAISSNGDAPISLRC